MADWLSMKISRHYITINTGKGARRVHYRVCGSGPALLMIHQSPRSGAEYERLMLEWGKEFTCIAPDSPGYGNSDPLNNADPKLADFADAVVEFMDAIGLTSAGCYGFHSGGAIAMNLHVRYPGKFTVLVSGGYPIWSDEEKAMFASSYLPRFLPQVYGDHLTWLWGRMLEQTWFFPWFDRRTETRMTVAHQDPTKAAPGIAEVLDAGDNYRFGYNAVLQADSDIPPADTKCAPVHIATYKADPLARQLSRLPQLPEGWSFSLAENPPEFEAWAIGKLHENVAPAPAKLNEDSSAGFIAVKNAKFDGLIHWSGPKDATTLTLLGPGRALELLPADGSLRIDLPGHGLSSDIDSSASLADWVDVISQAVASFEKLNCVSGEGISALLALALSATDKFACACAISAHIPVDIDRWISEVPDFTPDRFGTYLTRAWRIVRAGRYFWPWFDVKHGNDITFDPANETPESMALEHRALLRCRAQLPLTEVLLRADRAALQKNAAKIDCWELAPWAKDRADIWRP